MFNPSKMMMNVANSSAIAGAAVWQFTKNGTLAQDFSFEDAASGGWTYIRTNCGALYITVDANNFAIKQDVKYKAADIKLQLWKLTALGTTGADKNSFVIVNDLFQNKILQPANLQSGAQLVLVDRPKTITAANTWLVTCPLIS